MRLRIASRQSDLARIQAHEVANALRKAQPGLEVEFHFSESLGDKNLTDPLWKMPGKGVFTADLTQDLIDGRADLVVHSWKDLPVEEREETEIAASLQRADTRDLLLFKKSSRTRLAEDSHIRIFSSSPRREYNLKPFLKTVLPGLKGEIEFTSVRGNIPTRCRKLMETSDIDGLIVAKAAIDRLLAAEAEEFQDGREKVSSTLRDCDWMVLPLSTNPAAPAQGALAIEVRKDRQDVKTLLAKIHDEKTFREAQLEREILKSHGGGCHQKIGATVLERPSGRLVFLRGLTEKGVVLREMSWRGQLEGPVKVLRSDWLFERKTLRSPKLPEGSTGLFVSHIAAWPEGFSFEGLVWTAGLGTWRKLAEKGIWVNGSTESLGEKEDLRLDRIRPGLKWAIATHSLASSEKEAFVTYELSPKERTEPPPSEGVLHWTSAALFEEALRRWPEIRGRQHSCGPGKTFDRMKPLVSNLSIRWGAEESAP
ncbi:MAG: hydroxymethylbilane synthase [Bdellovibrionaceae bacterium]|nr:hydroxymethylbilane synthase [Pseudobdellovibrionaceae bacterium]